MTLETLKKRINKTISLLLGIGVLLFATGSVAAMFNKDELALGMLVFLVAPVMFFTVILIIQKDAVREYIRDIEEKQAVTEFAITQLEEVKKLLSCKEEDVLKNIKNATINFKDVFIDNIVNVSCDAIEIRATLERKLADLEKKIIKNKERKKEIRRPFVVYLFRNKLSEANE